MSAPQGGIAADLAKSYAAAGGPPGYDRPSSPISDHNNGADLPTPQATRPEQEGHGWYTGFMHGTGFLIGVLGAIPCCFCCPNPYKQVDQGTVGLVTRFGRYTHAVHPGLNYINPLTERVHPADMRVQVVDIPKQESMTRDGVTLGITSVLSYRIEDPVKALFTVKNIRAALIDRTQTTLREVVGSNTIDFVTSERKKLSDDVCQSVKSFARNWGIKVESMLIRDVFLSDDLQKSLSQAAQAKRAGESKVISAQAEVDAARLMRQAADILSSDAAMQIRYLETMKAMAGASNTKTIFMPGMDSSRGAFVDMAPGPSSGKGKSSDIATVQQAALLENI